MKLVFCLVAALCLPMGVIAQLSTSTAVQDSPPSTSPMDAALFYQLLLGELNVQEGEPGTGYSLLLDAARKTNDASLFQRAIDVALQSRAGEAALQAARSWSQAQPSSREARQITLQILIALNRVGETGDLLAAELAALPMKATSSSPPTSTRAPSPPNPTRRASW
jgi:hypothetical protein